MSTPRYNVKWTREELVLALNLYCQIPFAKTKANNPEVISLAKFIGRTPSSVARKLGNFGAFDPLLAERGISGLSHYSKADEAVWNEFHRDWKALVIESHRLLSQPSPFDDETNDEFIPRNSNPQTTQRKVETIARVGQSFFRRSVLSSYAYTCCVCGIDLNELLVGSHIVPWSVDVDQRLDPQNGLSMCVLHDKSFDKGLISISTDLTIMVASRVFSSQSDFSETAIGSFRNQEIRLPQRFAPHPENLFWHNENVYLG